MIGGKTLEEAMIDDAATIVQKTVEKISPTIVESKLPILENENFSTISENIHCDHSKTCSNNSGLNPSLTKINGDESITFVYRKNKENSLPEAIKTSTTEFSDGFYALTRKMDEIHRAKNADYAGDDPYSNFMQCKALGIDAFLGVLVRMGDKYSRIVNLAKKGSEGEVKDESIMDTLIDLANYSLIAILVKQHEDDKSNVSKK